MTDSTNPGAAPAERPEPKPTDPTAAVEQAEGAEAARSVESAEAAPAVETVESAATDESTSAQADPPVQPARSAPTASAPTASVPAGSWTSEGRTSDAPTTASYPFAADGQPVSAPYAGYPAGASASAAPAAPSSATMPDAKRPHPAQFGTIVWGMLLLALCGFVAITQFGPGVDADRYLWAFLGVIAAGVALVAVGIAAAFRRS